MVYLFAPKLLWPLPPKPKGSTRRAPYSRVHIVKDRLSIAQAGQWERLFLLLKEDSPVPGGLLAAVDSTLATAARGLSYAATNG
eukprot:1256553-Amphidinium_carterae.1